MGFKCFQLALQIRCFVSLGSEESTPASLGSGSLSFGQGWSDDDLRRDSGLREVRAAQPPLLWWL